MREQREKATLVRVRLAQIGGLLAEFLARSPELAVTGGKRVAGLGNRSRKSADFGDFRRHRRPLSLLWQRGSGISQFR